MGISCFSVDLLLLFSKTNMIGHASWEAVERNHPETHEWTNVFAYELDVSCTFQACFVSFLHIYLLISKKKNNFALLKD